jgi:type I restriction enzyme, S subunit
MSISKNEAWDIFPIKELCLGIYDGPHATPEKTLSGPIFLGISSLSKGRIDLSKSENLSEDNFKKWTRRITPQSNDVVFSYETRLGEAALIPEGLRCCLGRRMALMRPNLSKVDPQFLLYAYLSPEFQNTVRERTIHGSTVDRILLTEFPEYPITVPPLPEQKAIARILGALDDKIELNQKMNQTLEAMAQAIFKSWFVDFDPVRAKMAGQQPVGMDEATAALFPDSIEDSELGEIPKGWKVTEAQNISEIGIGKTPPRKEKKWFSHDSSDIRWMSIRDLGCSGVFISSTSEFLKSEAVDMFNIKTIPDNTVVLSFKLTIGRVAITDGEMLSNEAIAHFNLKNSILISEKYLFLYLKNFKYDSLGNTSSIATAINSKIIKSMPVLLPPKIMINHFDSLVENLFYEIKILQSQSQTLSTLRDILLPKLMSGELRVPEADRQIAELV